MSEIKVTKAEQNDIEAINRLRLQVQIIHTQAHPDIFKSEPDKSFYEEIRALMQTPDTHVICAKNGAEIIGYAVYQYRHSEGSDKTNPICSCKVEELCVDSPLKKTGYRKTYNRLH